ncbi:MAG TPA: hypothetical protein DC064_29465 [Cyanobacteria bacterium UBA9273]|nr:hypothetical protein [Cyanobacteria bacterium UBA9273]
MQKKTKLINKIFASTLLGLALASPSQPMAQSQERSTFLLRLNCVDRGMGNWAYRNEDVAVGKAVYTSILFMGPGDSTASLTCRLQPNDANAIFQRLDLEFGMRDNDQRSPNVAVNVYLDGVQAASVPVSPGKPEMVSLDVTSTQNVTLEAACSSKFQYCDRVYFWKAALVFAP